MLKPKFTFRVSEEYLKESPLYTAELLYNGGTYSISWDYNTLYYNEPKVQEFIDNGVWRIQEELNGTAEMS